MRIIVLASDRRIRKRARLKMRDDFARQFAEYITFRARHKAIRTVSAASMITIRKSEPRMKFTQAKMLKVVRVASPSSHHAQRSPARKEVQARPTVRIPRPMAKAPQERNTNPIYTKSAGCARRSSSVVSPVNLRSSGNKMKSGRRTRKAVPISIASNPTPAIAAQESAGTRSRFWETAGLLCSACIEFAF